MNRPSWGRPLKRSLRYAALAGVLVWSGRGSADAALPAGNVLSDGELSRSPAAQDHSNMLPVPLASMTGKDFSNWLEGKMSGKAFPAWSKELKRARKCKGHNGCATDAESTEVAIAASTDANDINLDNLQKERVALRMYVTKKSFGRDRPDELTYALSGRDGVYYLVVQPWPNDSTHPNPNPGGKAAAQWSLVEVDGDGYHQVVGSGVFQRCCLSNRQSDPDHCTIYEFSYADFNDCSVSHLQYGKAFRDFQQSRSKDEEKKAGARLASLNTLSLTATAWVSCSHGCCIAGPK